MICYTRSFVTWLLVAILILSCKKTNPAPEEPREEPDVAQTVFVADVHGYVYAIDAQTGTLTWETKIGIPYSSAPTLANGIVYIGGVSNVGGLNNLYALDAATGAIKWTAMLNHPDLDYPGWGYIRSIPTVAQGVVYVSTEGSNMLYALDAMTGTKKWEFSTGRLKIGDPTVVNGTVFIGCSTKLFALDARTGAIKWEVKDLRTGSPLNPSVVDGVVYYLSTGGLSAHDATTGIQKWIINKDFRYVNFTVGNGRIFVKGVGISIYNAKNGQPIGSYPSQEYVHWDGNSSPVFDNGVVYVGQGGFTNQSGGTFSFHAFDALTGTTKWIQKTKQPTNVSPTVAAGTVIVGTFGKVYAMDALTGVIKWGVENSGSSITFTPACVLTKKGVVHHSSNSGDQQ